MQSHQIPRISGLTSPPVGFHIDFEEEIFQHMKSHSDRHRREEEQFLETCRGSGQPINPEKLNEFIGGLEAEESKRTQKSLFSRAMRKIVAALKDYEAVINSLVSAYPMPTAIIWGGLSVIINCGHRNFELFDNISNELHTISNIIEKINVYNKLYAESERLQRLLSKSYVSMFCFWSKVYKIYNERGLKRMASSFVSTTAKKLNRIIDGVKTVAEQIRDVAELIQQEMGRCKEIRKWLRSQQIYDSNRRDYERNLKRCIDGTSNAFINHPTFSSWSNTGNTPILWLYSAPGSGKSILCSRIINYINEAETATPVVYHFYQFDRRQTACETFQHLAHQLFDKFCQDRKYDNLQEPLVEPKGDVCTKEVQTFITMLIRSFPRVHFILDGLDEGMNDSSQWIQVKAVLDFLISCHTAYPSAVRLLCISQHRDAIKETLQSCTAINIAKQLEEDMTAYLQSVVSEMRFRRETRDVVQELRKRAAGSFLWARFMVDELRDAESPADRTDKLNRSSLSTLDEYYKERFKRIRTCHRALACEVFTLIAFSIRPLTMHELVEAIGMLRSKDPHNLDLYEIPELDSKRMQELFAPLIVMEKCQSKDTQDTCRLVHSTVLDFLQRHPTAICNETKSTSNAALRFTPLLIAEACILYLGQDCFTELLNKRNGCWVDKNNKTVDEHYFLTYAAKYWHKHLGVITDEETAGWAIRVQEFITSSNFKTCIQVQSLWVEIQFGNFRDPDGLSYFRQAFPRWFVKLDSGRQMWKNYNRFLYDWQYFLNSRSCSVSVIGSYTGDLDYCWWAALGPHNFLSRMKCYYNDFRLQEAGDVVLGPHLRFEGTTATGHKMKVLQLKSEQQGELEFVCEHWSVPGGHPTVRKQSIFVQEAASNWALNSKRLFSKDHNPVPFQVGAAFSYDCQYLRIGSQLFSLNNEGDYAFISSLTPQVKHYPNIIEEFSIRGQFVALATRQRIKGDSTSDRDIQAKVNMGTNQGTACLELEPLHQESRTSSFCMKLIHTFSLYFQFLFVIILSVLAGPAALQAIGKYASKAEYTEEHREPAPRLMSAGTDSYKSEESTFASSTESDNKASESWSDCSSQHPEDITSEDSEENSSESSPCSSHEDEDATDFSTSHPSESEGERDTSSVSDGCPLHSIQSEDADESGHADDESGADSTTCSNNSSIEGLESCEESSDESIFESLLPYRTGFVAGGGSRKRTQEASIVVFDISTDTPTKVFQFKQAVTRSLYDSPPVLHPFVPLVVWPLGNGDVLFADLQNNSFFTRHLRPSAGNMRHVFIRCHFSENGRFLHIASLEKQSHPELGYNAQPLTLMVSSFRLCAVQPSRSPPTLIHRVKKPMAGTTSSSAQQLPYTMTWTPRELYFTLGAKILTVFRVSLFRPDQVKQQGGYSVLKPEKNILLPGSAEKRLVYYFPPTENCESAKILIGSERIEDEDLRAHESDGLSPPVGCLLDEQEDLGGWKRADDYSDAFKLISIGSLDRRMEKFNPDDDCEDLVPFTL